MRVAAGKKKNSNSTYTFVVIIAILGLIILFANFGSTDCDDSSTDYSSSIIDRKISDHNLGGGGRTFPRCTKEQMETLQEQFGPGKLKQTRCPDTTSWLKPYYSMTTRAMQDDAFLGIFVGCTKGFNAVNALRMGSNNPKYEKLSWKLHVHYDEGICARQNEDFPIDSSNSEIYPAQVFCLQPIPDTLAGLTRSKRELGWGDEFMLDQVAFGDEEGTLLVPKTEDRIEAQGIKQFGGACGDPDNDCVEVPIVRLDNYVNKMLPHHKGPIHYLSIDVEGSDLNVLMGADSLFHRVQYLEFEYHVQWGPNKSLVTALDILHEHNFVCYWAGSEGRLWRISGCWQDHYAKKEYSNIACVNAKMEEVGTLAEIMEERFEKTLNGLD